MEPITIRHRGFLVESSPVPAGLLRLLETGGLATMTARTIKGAYVESCVPLDRLPARFELAGVEVRSVRPAGDGCRWRTVAMPAREQRQRLRSPRAAEWLPTLPAT
jgi:hypothetical protein